MSGATTIREVILKISLEMAQSKVRAPDFSEVERKIKDLRGQYQAAFRGGPAGAGMGGGGTVGHGGVTFGTGNISGVDIEGRVRQNRIRDNVRALEIMERQESVLRRTTRALAESATAHATATAAATRHNGALVQLIASHEGMLRIPNGTARMLGMLPTGPGAALMAGVAAAAIPAVDSSMRRGNALDMARRGVLPEGAEIDTSFSGWNTTAGPGSGPTRRVVRPDGLGKAVWRGMDRFAMATAEINPFDALFGGNQLMADREANFRVDLANERAMQQKSRDQQARDAIRGQTMREYRGAIHRDDYLQSTGQISSQQRLGRLEAQQAYGIKRLSERPAGELDGQFGGAQREADVAGFRLENTRQQLSVQQAIVRELDAERSKILENTRAAKSHLDVERERLTQRQTAFGLSDATDFGKMNRIAEKIKRGEELNLDEARFAAQNDIAGDQVRRFGQERFNRNVSPENQEALGLGREMAEAQRNFADAMRDQRDALPDIQEDIESFTEKINETFAAIPKMEEAFAKLADAVAKMANLMDRNAKDAQQAVARANHHG